MSARHTPGPWHRNIKPARRYPVIFAGRNTHVATIHHTTGISDEEAEANHDLITSAPKLLEALKALLAYEDDRPARGTHGATVYAAAERAVAEAEGGDHA